MSEDEIKEKLENRDEKEGQESPENTNPSQPVEELPDGSNAEQPATPGKKGKGRKIAEIIILVILLYVFQQYALGLIFSSLLKDTLYKVCGSSARYRAARIDLVRGQVVLSGLQTEGWLVPGRMRIAKVVINARHSDIINKRVQIKAVKLINPVMISSTTDAPGEEDPQELEGMQTAYLVEKVSIVNGVMLFQDPPAGDFRFEISDINGIIENLTNTATLVEEPSKLELEGRLPGDNGGKCILWGTFNPRFPKANFHFNMRLHDLSLTIFEPYGEDAYFERGWLDYKLTAVCENYSLKTKNEAVLRDIQIRERKFTLRKLFGLTADNISAHINKEKGGFKISFDVKGSMRDDPLDIFMALVDRMAVEGENALKAGAGATLKSNLKGILF